MAKKIDEEVQFHIDETIDALVAQGWTPEAAHAEATRRFGNPAAYRRRLTALYRLGALRELTRVDWRDACRSLRASPVVTLAALLSLALGIGANTALFSIVNGLLLKPLPVHEPQRLASLTGGDWTNPIWERIRDHHSTLFANTAAWANQTFDLSERGESEVVDGIYVSGGFFDLLGVRPDAGRTLLPDDDARGGGAAGPVAVISHGLWQRRFGGTSAIVGQRLTVNRLPFTIVGVLPKAFFGPEVGRAPDVYLPLSAEALIRGSESRLDERSASWLEILVRLRPGQTLDDAAASLNSVHEDIRAATIPARLVGRPRSAYLDGQFSVEDASTGKSALRSRFAQPLVAITVIVAGVLLIACANIANLMLARASARRHEISVRLALGASRARIVRQMLAEAVILSALGVAGGLIVAQWGGALLVQQLGSSASSITLDLSLDWRVLGATGLVAIVTTIFFGLTPVAGLSGVRPNEALRDTGRGSVGDRRMTLRSGLVVAQVALSLVLIVAAGLFVRTFHRLATAPLGFSPESLLIVNIDASRSTVAPEALPDLYRRAAAAAARIPGVRAASASLLTPLSGRGWNNRVATMDGSEPPRDRVTFENAVGPEWFATYGMQMRTGRAFNESDTKGAPLVAIVNETFVRQLLGETPPIGARVTVGQPPMARTFDIVGVVNDAVYRSARRGVVPTMYHPLEQAGTLNTSFAVTLDVAGSRRQLSSSLRDALQQADPALAFALREYTDQVGAGIAQERLVAMLSGFFGVLAMVIAAIGLYGMTSYAVSRRTTELAIRMALGADSGRVLRLVFRHAATVVACGAVLGLALSVWASRFVSSLLFDVQGDDPWTLISAIGALSLVAFVASWLPARRASRLDPNHILRR